MPGAVSFWWAAGSQAVDQSSTRNKRNDRLAEGHERVASTVMVLRMPQTMRPKAEDVTVYNRAPCQSVDHRCTIACGQRADL